MNISSSIVKYSRHPRNNKPKVETKVFISSKKQSISKEVETRNDVTLYIDRGQAKKSAGWMPWH